LAERDKRQYHQLRHRNHKKFIATEKSIKGLWRTMALSQENRNSVHDTHLRGTITTEYIGNALTIVTVSHWYQELLLNETR
jgi:hypothetical protein